jgi:hypothetical protein
MLTLSPSVWMATGSSQRSRSQQFDWVLQACAGDEGAEGPKNVQWEELGHPWFCVEFAGEE